MEWTKGRRAAAYALVFAVTVAGTWWWASRADDRLAGDLAGLPGVTEVRRSDGRTPVVVFETGATADEVASVRSALAASDVVGADRWRLAMGPATVTSVPTDVAVDALRILGAAELPAVAGVEIVGDDDSVILDVTAATGSQRVAAAHELLVAWAAADAVVPPAARARVGVVDDDRPSVLDEAAFAHAARAASTLAPVAEAEPGLEALRPSAWLLSPRRVRVTLQVTEADAMGAAWADAQRALGAGSGIELAVTTTGEETEELAGPLADAPGVALRYASELRSHGATGVRRLRTDLSEAAVVVDDPADGSAVAGVAARRAPGHDLTLIWPGDWTDAELTGSEDERVQGTPADVRRLLPRVLALRDRGYAVSFFVPQGEKRAVLSVHPVGGADRALDVDWDAPAVPARMLREIRSLGWSGRALVSFPAGRLDADDCDADHDIALATVASTSAGRAGAVSVTGNPCSVDPGTAEDLAAKVAAAWDRTAR